MICCPSCGYSWVDVESTHSGRWLGRWFRRRHRRLGGRHAITGLTLSDVPVGWKARLRSWEGTPAPHRRQLRAYGLTESDWIYVLQHVPTTIIRVARTELALDRDLTDTLCVEAMQPAEPTTEPAEHLA